MQKRIISVCSVTISLCIICLMAWKIYTWEIQSDIESGNIATESTDEEPEEDIVKQICERVKSIDYSVQEYPIDTNLYDSKTDEEYKNAFLQALLSRTPIRDNENGEYYIRELREELRYGRSTISEEAYIGFLNDLFRFYYLDFDGDGLPELFINGGGHILKYCPDDKQVYDIAPKNMGQWDLLGSGKIYYHIESDSAYFIKYGYQEINSSGEVDREVIFEYNFLPDSPTEYLVSIDEFEEVEVGKENWELLTQGLLDAEANAFPHMTFDDLFGDMDIEPLQNDENSLILTDEVYLFEKEFDPEARTGGKIEVHYPQIKRGTSPELDRQINIILRDTAFSFFDDFEEITYEEALDLIAEETKDSVWDVTIDYPVLHYNNAYISLIFLVESCNGARVNINHYLATIDLTTGQYIHFNDLLNMDELSRLLRNNLFDVYEGTYAEFKEEDAHEPEVIEEFIETIEKRLNSPDTTQWLYGEVMEHTAANPHYGLDNGQNIALDDKYLYIRFYDSEYYALNDHFILRIPLEYTNIEVPGSELEEPVTVIAKETHYYASGSLKYWYEYEYDSAGNKTKYIKYNADGSVDWWYKYEYDSAGNETKYIKYNADGSIDDWCECEYDSMENLTKKTKYNTDGSIDDWYEYEYGDAGNQTKFTQYDSDGSINSGWEKDYDRAGNNTKSYYYGHDGSLKYWYEHEYDSAGNCIRRTQYYDDGSVDGWSEWEYDSDGNRTKDIRHWSDGGLEHWYEYDSAGNRTKQIEYRTSGGIYEWIEWEYITIIPQ